MIRPFIVTLQTASVAASGTGFQTSRPVPSLFRVDSVFIESSYASADIYAMIGASNGPVSSLILALGADNFIDSIGQQDTTQSRSAIPMPGGTSPLVYMGRLVLPPLNRLWIGCINEDASNATRINATVQGVWLTDIQDYSADFLTRAIEELKAYPANPQSAGGSQGSVFRPIQATEGTQATSGTGGIILAGGISSSAPSAIETTPAQSERDRARQALNAQLLYRSSTPTPPPPPP